MLAWWMNTAICLAVIVVGLFVVVRLWLSQNGEN